MKIKPKVTLTFLIISLVALVITSILSYFIAKNSLTRQVLNQLESVAAIQKNRLESIADQNLERLVLVSSRTELRLSLDKFILEPRVEYQDKMNRILRDARASVPSFREISVLTLDGKIVSSTDESLIGEKRSGEDYFIRGRSRAGADIFFLDEDKYLRVYLSGPLRLQAKLIGVVVIESDVENIISLVEDYSGLGETGETLLARSTETGDALFLMPLRFDPDAALSRIVYREELNDPMIQALTTHLRFLTDAVDYREEPVLAVTHYIDKTDWGLAVKIDKKEAFAPAIRLRNLLLLVIIVSSIAVVAASFYTAGTITTPIINLTRVASRISEGDLSQRVAITTEDEIGISARAFNQMAENLIEAKIGLEKKVDERTAELAKTNKELVESIGELKRLQDKLIQAEKLSALGRLTADVAHEIRNPLTVIGGFAKRLEKRLMETTKEMDYARMIVSEVTRLEGLLREVLSFSKEAKCHLTYLNINDIVSELFLAYYDVCREKSIQLKRELAADIPHIPVDKDQIIQALNNLITNAVDAMPEGGVLKLTTRMEKIYDVNYAVIDISDTGVGIPKDKLEMLFEPFYSSRATGHGTGLGLSICKKIMEEHQGMIRVSSTVGKGSTLSLCFPHEPAEDAFKAQCWEYTRCGIEKAEGAVEGRCPAYPNYGRICWAVAGTFSEGKTVCAIAEKLGDCRKCEFFNRVVERKDI